MSKEVFEKKTCSLELRGGLNGIDYPQKFVKAKSEAPFPCNHAAQMVHPNDPAMKITLGK